MQNEREVLYAEATVGDEERELVREVLDNPKQLVNGPRTAELEESISSLFEKSYGVMVNSGSSANYLAIEAADFPEDGEVITPATTFSTTVAPIVKNDLTPVFVDIDPETYQVSIPQVREAISSETYGLMIPSLVGNLPKFDELRDIANEHDLTFIEDSADTIGARYNGNSTGHYSDISTTSFYGSHIITGFGGGGMVCVNDSDVRDTMKKLRGWGRGSAVDETEDIDTRLDFQIDDIRYDSKFIFDEVGYNFLPLEVSAAFCLAQLENLDELAETRTRNFERLHETLSAHDDLFRLPKTYDGVDTNWLAFPLTIRESAPFGREKIVKHLEKNGIQTRSLWSGNILRHPGFKDIPHRVGPDELTHADYIMENSFVIGCHQSITDEDLEYVATVFENFRD